VFIQRGEMWRITEIDEEEETVTVSPIEDPAGEVPSWVGQEIPVPPDVAREVGELRRVAGSQLQAARRRSASRRTWRTATTPRRRRSPPGSNNSKARGRPPTDEDVVVEMRGREAVVNACFGHKINETLGRTLSALLVSAPPATVAMEVDPYRIELELPKGASAAPTPSRF